MRLDQLVTTKEKKKLLTRTGLSGRVATGSTGVLLNVERTTSTSLAESMRLVVTLTETGGTLCRKEKKNVNTEPEQ